LFFAEITLTQASDPAISFVGSNSILSQSITTIRSAGCVAAGTGAGYLIANKFIAAETLFLAELILPGSALVGMVVGAAISNVFAYYSNDENYLTQCIAGLNIIPYFVYQNRIKSTNQE
jgi:hypothetical protein